MADFFSLLSLPPAFTLDTEQLESAYFAAQRRYHPDRWVGKPEPERVQALLQSAEVNKAYETLKNPLSRAQYLLHLQGIAVGTDKDSMKPSQALLVEIMELREEPPAAQTLARMQEESIRRIASLYEQKHWQEMAQETLRLGYLMKAHHT